MSTSVITGRDQWNNPAATITLTGESDIHRFAYNLLRQQVEFAEMGRQILFAQRKRIGKAKWDAMWKTLHGDAEKPMTFQWKQDV